MPRFPRPSTTTLEMRATSFGPFADRMAQLMARDELIPLHIGDTWLLPPEPARRIDLDQAQVHRYAAINGLDPLREAVTERFHSKYGIKSSKDEIVITPGSTGGLSLVVEAIFDPGDEVILLTPSWPLIFGILQRRGVKIHEVPVGFDGVPTAQGLPDFKDRLAKALTSKTTAIYFCDPNNPCGFIYPEPWIEAISAFAVAHDLWIINDIAYADLCFVDGFKPLAARDAQLKISNRTITAHTFSKTYALAGHRIGTIHAPSPVKELMARLMTHSTYHTSTSAQEMVLACIRAGAGAEIAASYEAGARMTDEVLRLPFASAQAGPFVFVDFRKFGIKTHEDGLALLGRCLDVGVSLCPGRVFGEHFAAFARLCYTAVPLDRFRDGLERLNTLFNV